MEKFEHIGLWWLPNQPDNQISGSLKFDPLNGIKLELIGSFHEFMDSRRIREEEIILGVTSDGKRVTLSKCFESQSSMSFGAGISTSSYIAQVIFIGHHFEKAEDITLSSFSIGYYYLEEWAGITGFSHRRDNGEPASRTKEIITYSFPDEINIDVGEYKISLTYRYTSGGSRLKEVVMKHITYLQVTPKEPVTFSCFANKINFLLQNFITLGLGKATRPTFITTTTEQAKYEYPEGKTQYKDIEIYYAVNELPDVSKDLHPHDMTFTLSDINDILAITLTNWFNKEDLLRPVYDLFFATINSSSIYLTHEFLNLSQGLESYHRRVRGGNYIVSAEYEELKQTLINAIPSTIPDYYRNTLRQRLEYLNEYSLRRRLKDLIDNCSAIFSTFVSNQELFIDQVVGTRNYLTHYDKKPEASVLQGENLYWVTRKLRALLEIYLLKEIGLTDELIAKLLNRNQQLLFLKQK